MLCHVVDHFKCVFFNKKFPFFVLLISSFSLTIIIRKVVVMDVQKGLFMPFISIIYWIAFFEMLVGCFEKPSSRSTFFVFPVVKDEFFPFQIRLPLPLPRQRNHNFFLEKGIFCVKKFKMCLHHAESQKGIFVVSTFCLQIDLEEHLILTNCTNDRIPVN